MASDADAFFDLDEQGFPAPPFDQHETGEGEGERKHFLVGGFGGHRVREDLFQFPPRFQHSAALLVSAAMPGIDQDRA